jgi:CheY-like chemotaxis protein
MPARMSPLILLIDHYEDGRFLMSLVLESAGFRVMSAANGHDALALARTHQPAAVVIDLELPDMGGLETIGQLKTYPGLARIPIIAYSALPAPDDTDLFYAVCLKPCPPQAVVEILRDALVGTPRRAPRYGWHRGTWPY